MTLEMFSTVEEYIINRHTLKDETLTAAQIAEGYVLNGTHAIGPGTSLDLISGWESTNPVIDYNGANHANHYIFRVSISESDGFIAIIRQPRFDPTATYYAWDSAYGSDTTKSYTSAGKEILSDWREDGAVWQEGLDGWGLGSASSPGIIASVVGAGDGPIDPDLEYVVHTNVDIHVSVVGTFGTANINPELNLNNFLKVIEP